MEAIVQNFDFAVHPSVSGRIMTADQARNELYQHFGGNHIILIRSNYSD